jgi:CRP-like cAMP-binding protein
MEDLVLENLAAKRIGKRRGGSEQFSRLNLTSSEHKIVESLDGSNHQPDGTRPPSQKTAIEPTNLDCSCSVCPADQLNLCAAMRTVYPSEADMPPVQTAPARRTICHPKDWSEFVPIICKGWAASSIFLTDGRRQILSFLLSGDLVSTASIFGATSGRSVEAITEVTYRKFRRDDVKAALFKNPDLLESLSQVWIEEREQSDQLAIDLGRRTADERIARLLLNLADKLVKRRLMNGPTMHFPIRHRHIADATGLTTNHVCKVMLKLQKARLINVKNRSLTIINAAELHHAADWH